MGVPSWLSGSLPLEMPAEAQSFGVRDPLLQTEPLEQLNAEWPLDRFAPHVFLLFPRGVARAGRMLGHRATRGSASSYNPIHCFRQWCFSLNNLFMDIDGNLGEI